MLCLKGLLLLCVCALVLSEVMQTLFRLFVVNIIQDLDYEKLCWEIVKIVKLERILKIFLPKIQELNGYKFIPMNLVPYSMFNEKYWNTEKTTANSHGSIFTAWLFQRPLGKHLQSFWSQELRETGNYAHFKRGQRRGTEAEERKLY